MREIYNTDSFIPLHEPRFVGNEKKYLNECIDSTYVSSVGKFVCEFEKKLAQYVGAKYAIATTKETSALHNALLLANVTKNDEVNMIVCQIAHSIFNVSKKIVDSLISKKLKNIIEIGPGMGILTQHLIINKTCGRM